MLLEQLGLLLAREILSVFSAFDERCPRKLLGNIFLEIGFLKNTRFLLI